MLKKRVLDTVRKHNLINMGDHIVIGLSGGPDSVCLFHVLKDLSAELGCTLHTVHVNHMFRPYAAEEDQRYAERLAAKSGIDHRTYVIDCKASAEELGVSHEEAGRKARYDAFSERAREIAEAEVSASAAMPGNDDAKSMQRESLPSEKVKIAVAHNRNDQAETLLIRLMRGTGTRGLAGMEYLRRRERASVIIRPLLDIDRNEIERYCKIHVLAPRTDESNFKPVYTRNKVRLELIPFIEEHFGIDITSSMNRLAAAAGEENEFMTKIVEEELALITADKSEEPGNPQRKTLMLDGLKKAAPALRHRMLIMAFEGIGLVQDISAAHIEAADAVIEKGETSKSVDFPHGYVLQTEYEKVILKKRYSGAEKSSPEEACSRGTAGVIKNPYRKKVFAVDRTKAEMLKEQVNWHMGVHSPCGPPGLYVIVFFDWDAIKREKEAVSIKDIEVRTRMSGDFFSLGANRGRKKIKEYFIDVKMPRYMRDKLPLAAIGHEVLWVAGNGTDIRDRYSGKYRVDDDTKTVLVIELFDCI